MSYWEASGKSDDWYTPLSVFSALGCQFDMDVAAAPDRAFVPADAYISKDGLDTEWAGFVWMNPPFGGRNGLTPWLDRFFEHGNGIALTPDRTSAPWFWPAWARADMVLFTRKLRFVRPDGSEGRSPSNGTALFAAGAQGCEALCRAAGLGFGILARPVLGRAIPITNSIARSRGRARGGGYMCSAPAPTSGYLP